MWLCERIDCKLKRMQNWPLSWKLPNHRVVIQTRVRQNADLWVWLTGGDSADCHWTSHRRSASVAPGTELPQSGPTRTQSTPSPAVRQWWKQEAIMLVCLVFVVCLFPGWHLSRFTVWPDLASRESSWHPYYPAPCHSLHTLFSFPSWQLTVPLPGSIFSLCKQVERGGVGGGVGNPLPALACGQTRGLGPSPQIIWLM